MSDNKLPKGWEYINLGSIAKVKGGKRLPIGHTYSTEITNFPYIRVTDFGNQTISFEKLKYLNTDTQKAIKNYTISCEDVYISIAGTIGVTGIIPQKLNGANLTENAAKITELNQCDKKFLSRYLSSMDGQSQIKQSTKTTTQPKLSLYRIAEIIIPLPPLETQQAIVSKIEELFSELDKGIEDLKTAQQQLRTYRQSVLKWAFEGKLTNVNVKEGELPEGWEMVPITKIVEQNKYALKAGPFGSSLKKEFYVPKGYKVYGQEQVISDNPFLGDYYVNEEKYQELKSCQIKPFDILISLVGTVGKVLILPENSKEGIINPRLIKISLNRDVYLPKFFKSYFESSVVKLFYSSITKGTTMDVLNLGIIKTIPFPLPPIKEQRLIVQEIESRLSVADKMEESISQSLQQAEALRQSILKKAFSGELV
nr:restriction endonuclease subunit S [uncultured Flavobacterium sp.]